MGNSMSSREVIKILKKAGWFLVATKGDHHHFKHPILTGRVTVPHPAKDVHTTLIKLIEKQADMKIKP